MQNCSHFVQASISQAGFVSLTIFRLWFKLMEIWHYYKFLASKFSTFHDNNTTVVSCAQFHSDQFITIWLSAKWNSHQIQITTEKSLVKWAPQAPLKFSSANHSEPSLEKRPPGFNREKRQLWHILDFSTYRADSRFVPSQWETALLCNDVSHWPGTSLESALNYNVNMIAMFAPDNRPTLVQVMVWHWTGDKPLSDPMMTKSFDPIQQHWATMS